MRAYRRNPNKVREVFEIAHHTYIERENVRKVIAGEDMCIA